MTPIRAPLLASPRQGPVKNRMTFLAPYDHRTCHGAEISTQIFVPQYYAHSKTVLMENVVVLLSESVPTV